VGNELLKVLATEQKEMQSLSNEEKWLIKNDKRAFHLLKLRKFWMNGWMDG